MRKILLVFAVALTLSGTDCIYQKPGGDPQIIGGIEYTYDIEGNLIAEEYTVRNVDENLFKSSSWGRFIPLNATVKSLKFKDDNVTLNRTYYLDEKGERHDLNMQYNYYVDGDLTESFNIYLDDNGQMVEEVYRESKYDSLYRPVLTVAYDMEWYNDPVTGKEYYELEPQWKYEYEYGQGTLRTVTSSYYSTDSNNNPIWVYDTRLTSGKDASGMSCEEKMWYDAYDSVWCGDYKWAWLEADLENGGIEYEDYYWSWNSGLHQWDLSGKEHSLWNDDGYLILMESYTTDKDMPVLYPERKYGYDYKDDGTECAYWEIVYNRPDSVQQLLGDEESLISYAQKTMYELYTPREIGWKDSYGEYNDGNLRKYEIVCEIDRYDTDPTKIEWYKASRKEFRYAVVPQQFIGRYAIRMTSQKFGYYYGNGIDVNWNQEEKYEYDEYGREILKDNYYNNVLTERTRMQFKYRGVPAYDGGTYMESYYEREEKWNLNQDSVLVCQWVRENEVDQKGHRVLDAYRWDWNESYGTWMFGNRDEQTYGEPGQEITSAHYNWDAEKKAWVGGKQVSVYDENGVQLRYSEFGGVIDEDGNAQWTPGSIAEKETDSAGNIIREESYYDWNTETQAWEYGSKSVYTYSEAGLLTGVELKELYGNVWFNRFKKEYSYDESGRMTQEIEYSCSYFQSDWYIKTKNVYTYTESGELKEFYSYSNRDGELQPSIRTVAQVSGGRIVEYVNSAYVQYDYDGQGNELWRWEVRSDVLISYDDATGTITETNRTWDSDNSKWQENDIVRKRYDSKHRIIWYESYSKEYISYYDNQGIYHYGDSVAMVGSEKYEYEFDDEGREIMRAYYDWNYNTQEWYGSYKNEDSSFGTAYYEWDPQKKDWRGQLYKYEYEYDTLGNKTVDATYTWSDQKWGWVAKSKNEYKYDANGVRIMVSRYETDDSGNWIGSNKRIYYEKDGVRYSESYRWDKMNNEWYGINKYESYDYDQYNYMYADYEWDAVDKCWKGTEKRELTSTENGKASTVYSWDPADKQWKYSTRTILEEKYRTDKNLEYQLQTLYTYNSAAAVWDMMYSLKMVFKYQVPTAMETVTDIPDITVYDGQITVSAGDALIRIISSAGAQVASGRGSVSAGVASGTYLIVIDGKTTKIAVK